MQTKTFIVGDTKQKNKLWNYPRLQINISEKDISFFPPVHKKFNIRLKFLNGEMINEKGIKYGDDTYLTNVIEDQHNRFGKGCVNAICAIWKDKKREGILHAWLKNHNLGAGDKVNITRLDGELYSLDIYDTRKRIKVAILGAGASADAGAPLLNNFFEKAIELAESSKLTFVEREMFNNVLDKRKKLLPGSDIEEFFSYIDFQINFDVLLGIPSEVNSILNKVYSKNNPNSIPVPFIQQAGLKKEDFKKLEIDISFLISKTLNETLKDTNIEIIRCYQKLIKTFDVVISFNWDLLYEHSYQRLKNKQLTVKQLGFGENGLDKPALLKLHGSFSWGLCNKCGLILFDSKIEHKIHNEGQICESCNEQKLIPISILPALTKFERLSKKSSNANNYYRNMWHAAMRAITEANEIVFFGYSLSDTDVHTKIFFKSGILNNRNSDLKIFVVSPSCNDGLKDRYTKAFKNKIISESFIKSTFKDYFKQS